MEHETILELQHVSKSFPGVKALDDVHFNLRKGELHALLGENGAGKSTLIKIIAGIYPMDSGKIIFDGKEIQICSVNDAKKLGISVIHQEISLVPQMRVSDNIMLGTEGNRVFVNYKERRRIAQEKVIEYGYGIDLDAKVETLSIAQQQIVEIIRALTANDAKVIVMDEPTASISESDASKLFSIIEKLKASGIGIIYITHRMEEVMQLADRITVFRDGQYIGTRDGAATNLSEIVSMMVGRTMDEGMEYRIKSVGEPILTLSGITNDKLKSVDFELRKGEVHGLYGLIGSGRTELAQVLFGIDHAQGEIYFEGSKVHIRSANDAMRLGIALVPENRKREGLSLIHSIQMNSTLTTIRRFLYGLRVNKKKMSEFLTASKRELNIKYASAEYPVSTLSGGNQQKVVLSKWLGTNPSVLILDEPTRGIDIGSKYEIYDLIFRLIEQGMSIILISSELPEIINLSTRVSIMHQGALVKTLNRNDFSQERILKFALNATK